MYEEGRAVNIPPFFTSKNEFFLFTELEKWRNMANTETSVPCGTAHVDRTDTSSIASDNVCEYCEESYDDCECLNCDECGEKKIDQWGDNYFYCETCMNTSCKECCEDWEGDWKKDYTDKCPDCIEELEGNIEEQKQWKPQEWVVKSLRGLIDTCELGDEMKAKWTAELEAYLQKYK